MSPPDNPPTVTGETAPTSLALLLAWKARNSERFNVPRDIRRTKIVAALGPSWEQTDQMQAMLDAGVDIDADQRVAARPKDGRMDHPAPAGAGRS
ncbi:MAG: hypothetical protein R2909_13210 [Gemmatimonadales bacterium]